MMSKGTFTHGWEQVHLFERDEAASRLALLTPQQGYEEFLSMYLLFGAHIPEDLKPLAEADSEERVLIAMRRHRAFSDLASARVARDREATP
ncbi:MAG: hypothetical protein PHU25_08135 [Deltaproteobacteria bacterium]|nr:hypothetical protein [Deltaproteobacteria bacterium]